MLDFESIMNERIRGLLSFRGIFPSARHPGESRDPVNKFRRAAMVA
jgi:hypothetical protein